MSARQLRLCQVALIAAGLFVTPAASAAQSAPPVRSTPAKSIYDDAGRRDPFVSLVKPKTTSPSKAAISTSRPGAGLAGVAVADIQVKGVMRSGESFIALLQGPDGRTFMAKRLDHLQDGVVSKIDRDSVVFTERAEDSAGQVHPRDVRKTVRAVVAAGGEL